MRERIQELKKSFANDINECTSADQLDAVRVTYLGRKGKLAALTKLFGTMAPEERGDAGRAVNEFKQHVQSVLDERAAQAHGSAEKRSDIDVTRDAVTRNVGTIHPLTATLESINEIFISLGFCIEKGVEIETEFANFEALNIPLEHPSRDAFDTFYVSQSKLLRSHTSTVQIKIMQQNKPPLQAIMPGKVYRPDAVDASHSFMFHQVEGLLVNRDVRFSDLKGVLNIFAKRMFGADVRLRFRPSFFPFTEPSAEVDISCIICGGKGCRVCSQTGWLEVLGAGMVNPRVFANVGYDPKKYTGFAFGMGVERIAMLKYGITDIRLFFENDIRFLKQF